MTTVTEAQESNVKSGAEAMIGADPKPLIVGGRHSFPKYHFNEY